MLVGIASLFFVSMKSTITIAIFFFAVILIIVAAIDPSTISELTASSKNLSLKRNQPSDAERELMLRMVTDEKNTIPIEEKGRILKEITSRKESEKSPEDFLLLSKEALEENKLDLALSNAYIGLSLEPIVKRSKAVLYYQLGKIFERIGNKQISAQKFQESNNIDPSYGWPLNELGLIYDLEGDQTKAELMYKKAIEADNEMAVSYCNLAELYEKQKRLQDSETNYKKAIDLWPFFSPFYVQLGHFYYSQGDYSQAKVAFENVISKDPEGKYREIAHTYALSNLGVILAKEGKKEEAIQKYKKALEIDPEFELARDNLSRIN